MKKSKLILLAFVLIIPFIGKSQTNKLNGKWKFNVQLIQQECANWIKNKTIEVKNLEGEPKATLSKELNLVKQIESSLHFSFTGLMYDFKTDSTLSVISTQGNVSTDITYQLKGDYLELKYPQIPNPYIYRCEFKDEKLYIYEIVNEIERFGQILEKI